MISLRKGRYFIDSNVFFYAKIGDKRYGRCCSRVIKKIYSREIEAFIDSLTLLEVSNSMMKFRFPRDEVKNEINAILSLPISVIEIRKEDVVESLKMELNPYDALHLLISERMGAQVITADRDFDDFNRVDPCDPSL